MSPYRRAALVGAAGVLVLLLAPGALSAQTAVRVPGTAVSLVPPAGFAAAARYPGFESQELRSSIMVSELPGPAAVMQRGMTAEALASRGMQLLGSSRHRIDGKDAMLLHVAQRAGADEVLKWMLIAGDEQATVMVVGTMPRESSQAVSDAVRVSVLTATRVAAAAKRPDHFEGLPFRVTPTRALKIAGRISNMVVLTETGTLQPQGADSAVFLVGGALAEVRIDDLRAYAETRVRQTDKVTNVTVRQGGELTIDGLPAYELVAEATEKGSNRSITVYQVLVRDSDAYVLMQGLVSPARAVGMLPEFRRVARSFRRVPR